LNKIIAGVYTCSGENGKMTDFQKEPNEIDEGADYVGYQQAFKLITSNVKTVGIEELPLALGVNRIAAANIIASVSYPTADIT
jgi:hypothetical protein